MALARRRPDGRIKKQGLSFYIGKIRKCLKWKIEGKEIFNDRDHFYKVNFLFILFALYGILIFLGN